MPTVTATPWYLPTPTVITTASATITCTETWAHWNDETTAATTSSIWTTWVLPAGTAGNATPMRGAFPRITDERAIHDMQAEGRRIAQRMHAHHEAAQAVKNAARDKARQLLLAQLDDRQRIDLASNGYFDLETIQPSGERRRYRIHRGRAGNVRRLDEQGREVRRFCIHPIMACPDEDTMLTQKLWLENNEELFLRTANVS